MNDILTKIYKALEKPLWNMTISERCELQKLLNKSIRVDDNNRFLTTVDRENFKYHINEFESDIQLINSKNKERILAQTATIQIALNRISDILKN